MTAGLAGSLLVPRQRGTGAGGRGEDRAAHVAGDDALAAAARERPGCPPLTDSRYEVSAQAEVEPDT